MDVERRELFKKWYTWSLTYKDCDPAIWMANYIFKRYEFNIEQRYWLCWFYANTYYYPTAFLLWNEFPDYELCDQEHITEWNTKNYSRLRYQTDTKYNKGHLPKMFESYKENVGNSLQSEYFESLYGDNEVQNFENIWKHVNKNFFKFGRYTTWFYLQSLNMCCNVPMIPSSLMLSDYEGSKSHRNGLCLALGKDEWVNTKLTAKETEWLEFEARSLWFEEIDHPDANPFTMETCLCSFKKIFRETNGRYLGYYLDRQSEEIQKVEQDGWNGIAWYVLWQARDEVLDKRLSTKNAKIQKEKYTQFVRSGKLERLDWLYPEESTKEGIELFI